VVCWLRVLCVSEISLHLPHASHDQVNVVVMRGVNDDEVGDFVEMTRHAPINVRWAVAVRWEEGAGGGSSC